LFYAYNEDKYNGEEEELMRCLVALLLLTLLSTPTYSRAAVAQNVNPDAAFNLIKQQSELFLLDVRTPGEYQQTRLQGARLIPIDQLVKRIAEIPKTRPILVYCAVGSRSAQVVNYLARRGYPKLYNLYGGIYSWAQKGYPVLQGGP
jgi:rhodanese-related sulfurtransferase